MKDIEEEILNNIEETITKADVKNLCRPLLNQFRRFRNDIKNRLC